MKLTLTRPVRQVLATILLLGGAVVPTLLVATIAWRINQPGHVRDVEVRLGRELGCRVTLDYTPEVREPMHVACGGPVRVL